MSSRKQVHILFTGGTISMRVDPATGATRVSRTVSSLAASYDDPDAAWAAAERIARFRTSSATTAKPRPWSPARAASMAR